MSSLDQARLPGDKDTIIRCSLYKSYFDGVMSKNCALLAGDQEAAECLGNYCAFVKSVSEILLRRKSTILGKEANLFTTNVDIFLEKALEEVGVDFNDGFIGRFQPHFGISNFKKAHFKRSLQYDNLSELPTFNLLKLHGSLTWRFEDNDKIVFSPDLSCVLDLRTTQVTEALTTAIDERDSIESLIAWSEGKQPDETIAVFLQAYERLAIVNPTKAKFKQTLLNETHYELLRIYSNELEKENTLLFALGFSFADEHIRQITLRAANSNPTLLVCIVAYDQRSAAEIRARFPESTVRNNNIEIETPPANNEGNEAFKYDLATFNAKQLIPIVKALRDEERKAQKVARP